MVREARFAWDPERPLPDEITRRDWDVDDPGTNPGARPAASRPRKRRRRAGTEPKPDSPPPAM
jgi:hypothetical protein